MIKAVLIDLDDTLIQNSADRFVEGYLRLLVPHLAATFPKVEADRLRLGLLKGTRRVIANCDPLQTNQTVFYEGFTEITGIPQAAMQAALQRFYGELYPTLQSLTTPIPDAPRVMRWLFDRNYAVAVATNPLFQRAAVEQRLAWAGMPPGEWPFWFISVLENVHFAKPSPHYYEEILTRLGYEPDEAVMVGDDWHNDIAPAWQAGFNTFWVRPAGTPIPDGSSVAPDGQGTLADFLQLIEDGWLQTLQPRPVLPQQIAPRMVGNVAALMGMVEEIPERFWHQRPDPNEWSPMEIVAHLRDSERNVQRPRLERILREDDPFLVAPQPPPAPGVQNLAGLDGLEIAREYAAERTKTLDMLGRLTPEDWTRPARHSVFGPTNLLEMAAFTARHDRLHINQLCQTLGKCE